ncbi:hypothetical protein AK812_SmicGene3884 [Symbiodinium microadriaticum]|uniref:Uncharacterized protein n=1 Tax=Symbiodinium microadriaticum TaxID=2951 RepID=A0A1Q9EXV0_SYMMI|nr:hypothetical protein AK812_SmicGene3884 [Symbiodinium microadriaticum]
MASATSSFYNDHKLDDDLVKVSGGLLFCFSLQTSPRPAPVGGTTRQAGKAHGVRIIRARVPYGKDVVDLGVIIILLVQCVAELGVIIILRRLVLDGKHVPGILDGLGAVPFAVSLLAGEEASSQLLHHPGGKWRKRWMLFMATCIVFFRNVLASGVDWGLPILGGLIDLVIAAGVGSGRGALVAENPKGCEASGHF